MINKTPSCILKSMATKLTIVALLSAIGILALGLAIIPAQNASAVTAHVSVGRVTVDTQDGSASINIGGERQAGS